MEIGEFQGQLCECVVLNPCILFGVFQSSTTGVGGKGLAIDSEPIQAQLLIIYFFDRERAVSRESSNLIGSGSGQYFPMS